MKRRAQTELDMPGVHFTQSGLTHKYEHMVEKFGWMLLARQRRDAHKLDCYKDALQHLAEQLVQAQHIYASPDVRHDLAVMLRNVQYLQKWSTTCLTMPEK